MGQLITEVGVNAIGSDAVSYSILSLFTYTTTNTVYNNASNDAFVIGSSNGSLLTNVLMSNFSYHYFILTIRASKPSGISTSSAAWVSKF